MIARPTKDALVRRAIGAANSLEYWAERLHDELKKQNIGLDPGSPDDGVTVVLPRYAVISLIAHMKQTIGEIRRFAPPAGNQIKA
jgi:hypothetical protein